MVRDFASPQISWMQVNRPAALRPDAVRPFMFRLQRESSSAQLILVHAQHTNDDCLHLAMGTGVVEGWTRYIAYWLQEKAAHDDEEAAAKASRWWFSWPWRD